MLVVLGTLLESTQDWKTLGHDLGILSPYLGSSISSDIFPTLCPELSWDLCTMPFNSTSVPSLYSCFHLLSGSSLTSSNTQKAFLTLLLSLNPLPSFLSLGHPSSSLEPSARVEKEPVLMDEHLAHEHRPVPALGSTGPSLDTPDP